MQVLVLERVWSESLADNATEYEVDLSGNGVFKQRNYFDPETGKNRDQWGKSNR